MSTKSPKSPAAAPVPLPELCHNLQSLQRQRAVIIKSRNMQANRLQAVVAGTLGYSSGLEEDARKKKFQEAGRLIKKVVAEARAAHLAQQADAANGVRKNLSEYGYPAHPFARVIVTTMYGIDAFNAHKKQLERQMVEAAAGLPVAGWVLRPEQRGFGLLFLAIVVGETGDIDNYPNPAKVWKRLGCAPWTFEGKTLMPATWRVGREGTLPKCEWEACGYSPRRRSIAYLVGECLVKLNYLKPVGGDDCESETENHSEPADDTSEGQAGGDDPLETEKSDAPPGPYRLRYLEAKANALANRPDWTRCPKCDGAGRGDRGGKCAGCDGTGKLAKRCHLHGMLLATKLLLKNLWVQWNPARAAELGVQPRAVMPSRGAKPVANVVVKPNQVMPPATRTPKASPAKAPARKAKAR